MVKQYSLRRFLVDNGLVLLMFGLFLAFLIGVSVTGYVANNHELQNHHQATQGFGQYVVSGEFIEAVFENWESEFLSVGVLLLLSVYLRERHSPESKPVAASDQATGR